MLVPTLILLDEKVETHAVRVNSIRRETMRRTTERKSQLGRRAVIERDGRKTIWHPLSLQQLQPDEFVEIVNQILDGRSQISAGTLRLVGRETSERVSTCLAQV